MNKKEIAIVLAAMCALLVFAIFMQLKTIKDTTTVISQTMEDNELRDEVLRAKEKYETLYNDYEKQAKEIGDIRKTVAERDSSLAEKEAQVKKNNKLLGYTDVTGDGVVIVLADNSGIANDSTVIATDVSEYVLHYIDLIQVVNALKNAGAEAISINGQRIVSTTAIVCIGNVISINGEKVANPFEIKAIGDQEKLYGGVTMLGGYVGILEKYGLVKSIEKRKNIEIPKYIGTYTMKYMKEVEE